MRYLLKLEEFLANVFLFLLWCLFMAAVFGAIGCTVQGPRTMPQSSSSQLARIEAKLDQIIEAKSIEDKQYGDMLACRKVCNGIVDRLRQEFENTVGDAESEDRANFYNNAEVRQCHEKCDLLPLPVSACGEY
jgi:hypothetical protein